MTPTIRATLEAAERELCPTGRAACAPLCGHCSRNAAAVAAFLRALPRDWRAIVRHETQWRVPAITGWTEDTTRDGPETAAHWHAMRLAAAVEAAAKEAGDV